MGCGLEEAVGLSATALMNQRSLLVMPRVTFAVEAVVQAYLVDFPLEG